MPKTRSTGVTVTALCPGSTATGFEKAADMGSASTKKSWKEMITSGIAAGKEQQINSLAWIREQSLSEDGVESLANHDPGVIPHTILL